MPGEGITFSAGEIDAYYASRAGDLNRTGTEWRGPCPIHQGEDDNFTVNSKTGQWHCHSQCGRGGGILALEMELTGADVKTAKAEIYRIIGRKRNHARTVRNSRVRTHSDSEKPTHDANEWPRVATHVYTDESGEPLFRAVRREQTTDGQRKKKFSLERLEAGRWRKGLGKVRTVPYRLHKIVNAKRVFIVEGEKCCDTIRKKLQLFATTNPMGAGKWSPDFNHYFKGKHVIVLPDNDPKGRAHAVAVAESLHTVAASVRILELPKLPEKGDVVNWVEAGGDRDALEGLVLATPIVDDASLAELRGRWWLDNAHVVIQFPFQITDEGVFWQRDGQDEAAKLAARVDVIAQTRDADGDNWGRLLQWHDNESRSHKWAMPMELLASDAGAVRARLLAEGLPYLATNPRLRERFTEYLQTAPTDARIRCVARVGWHDATFALPDCAIAPEGGEAALYQTPHEAVHHWRASGTADEWREHVGQRCGGNSRLILAVSCGFAGPLLSLVNAESGGIHFHGATSTGKSTALNVGGSVCGGGGRSGFVQTWRTTINGLEAIAEAHNDATLFLDELSQADPRDAGETAYLLGNGQGKGRMTKSIGARKKLAWNLIYVSAGELTLAEHAASAGKRTRGGAEVRLLNIDADAGAGMGVFEKLHGAASGDVFAHELKDAVLRFYGAPFRVFLEHLVVQREKVKIFALKVQKTVLDCVPPDAPGEVRRAAERFGLIGAAGELATRWG